MGETSSPEPHLPVTEGLQKASTRGPLTWAPLLVLPLSLYVTLGKFPSLGLNFPSCEGDLSLAPGALFCTNIPEFQNSPQICRILVQDPGVWVPHPLEARTGVASVKPMEKVASFSPESGRFKDKSFTPGDWPISGS